MSEPITFPATVLDLPVPRRNKWEHEYLAFRRLLPQLLATHKGQYVAIHDGQVVDCGEDKLALALRVLAKVGNVAIHVGLVTEEPEPIARSQAFAVTWGLAETPCDPVQLSIPTKTAGSVRLRYAPEPRQRRRTERRAGSAGQRPADRTLLPDTLVQALTLPQIGTIPIGGVGGTTQTMPSYPVQVTLHTLPPLTVEVVASGGESWILLGRDVLNAYRLLLDGPQSFLEIG